MNLFKRKILFFAALLIGATGAIGQAYMLYHELIYTYPYKVLDFPFYKNIADVGVICAPFIAIISGAFWGLKKRSLAIIFPVVFCPLLFALVFNLVAIYQAWNGVTDTGSGFEGITPAVAARDFFFYTTSLAFAGFIIGAVCNWILSRLTKPKKLP